MRARLGRMCRAIADRLDPPVILTVGHAASASWSPQATEMAKMVHRMEATSRVGRTA
jgi:hypothetical protein